MSVSLKIIDDRGRQAMSKLLALALLLPVACSTRTETREMNQLRDLIAGVLREDYEVQSLAEEIGQPAVPELTRLARHPDEGVRELALYCLDAIGGCDAAMVFTESFLDEEAAVSSAALRALRRHVCPGLAGDVLAMFDRVDSRFARESIPLILASTGLAELLAPLRQMLGRESDPAARTSLVVALARLGDENARHEFAALLRQEHGPSVRRDLLEHCEYIDEVWVVPPLSGWLKDKSPALYLGVDHSDVIPHLRVCDLVVVFVDRMAREGRLAPRVPAGAPFSFVVTSTTHFTDQQLAEVQDFVAALDGQ
jgi:hypothetical protein